MNIVIFGGTFDPPHIGHLKIIKKSFDFCDKMILIPSLLSPLKSNTPYANGKHRMEMLHLMISNINKDIVIDDFELRSKPPSYTINTIKYIQNKFKKSKLFFILGSDQFEKINKWHSYEEILESVSFICIHRNGNKKSFDHDCIHIYDINVDISSSEIRDSILNEKISLEKALHPSVLDYIKVHQIYN